MSVDYKFENIKPKTPSKYILCTCLRAISAYTLERGYKYRD